MTQTPEAVALLSEAERADAAQFLTFMLAAEHYGVDILRVQEIRGWEAVTRIPNAPAYVKGVINLRGAIVPIYDLRERFGMPRQPYTKETVVIVLRAAHAQGERSVGVVVDAVSDVLNTTESEVAATPEFGANVPTQALRGLVSDGDKMVMLIDVDLLTADDT